MCGKYRRDVIRINFMIIFIYMLLLDFHEIQIQTQSDFNEMECVPRRSASSIFRWKFLSFFLLWQKYTNK